MDTNSLNAFVAVARSGSFSLAAEQLHLTQPAISKRIAALESQLDCKLFDRFGRKITLTEAGRLLLPKAQRIMQELAACRSELTNLSEQVRGSLTLATSHHIGLHRLPEPLRHFTQAHPQVQLDIQFLDSEKACEAVIAGDIELAVITLSPDSSTQLVSKSLWRDNLCFVTSQEHPLAEKEQVSLADLADHPAVFPGTHTFTHHFVRQLFEQQQQSFQVAMYTNYLETIRMLVGLGRYWSVLPETMIESSLVKLPIAEGADLHRMLGYIHHRNRTLSRAAQAFIELLEGTG
ncbi:LysR family transcriptional regulator [Endozoicomonadaceae bacterium StTr2]